MSGRTYHLLEQRTPEWFALKAGRVGASDARAVTSTTKGGKESAARRDLRTATAIGALCGPSPEPGYVNADMERGIALEPVARALYEESTGELLDSSVGWVQVGGRRIGCSPDGLTLDRTGLVEIKCPRPANHIATVRSGQIPQEYRPQLLHQLLVVDTARWVDFVSFCDLPEPLTALRFERIRLERAAVRDEIDAYAAALDVFLAEVEDEIAAIRQLAGASC